MLRPPSSFFTQHIPVDIAGGSTANAALSARPASLIDQGPPQDGPCVVYSSDVKLKLAEDRYLHPDVTVGCTEQAEGVQTQPTVIIEILSPNTEKRERCVPARKSVAAFPLLLVNGVKVRHNFHAHFWSNLHPIYQLGRR
jgi:hypothetical protein